MQRLDTAAENLGLARKIGDFRHRDSCAHQRSACRRSASSCAPISGQKSGQLQQAGLVVNTRRARRIGTIALISPHPFGLRCFLSLLGVGGLFLLCVGVRFFLCPGLLRSFGFRFLRWVSAVAAA